MLQIHIAVYQEIEISTHNGHNLHPLSSFIASNWLIL